MAYVAYACHSYGSAAQKLASKPKLRSHLHGERHKFIEAMSWEGILGCHNIHGAVNADSVCISAELVLVSVHGMLHLRSGVPCAA